MPDPGPTKDAADPGKYHIDISGSDMRTPLAELYSSTNLPECYTITLRSPPSFDTCRVMRLAFGKTKQRFEQHGKKMNLHLNIPCAVDDEFVAFLKDTLLSSTIVVQGYFFDVSRIRYFSDVKPPWVSMLSYICDTSKNINTEPISFGIEGNRISVEDDKNLREIFDKVNLSSLLLVDIDIDPMARVSHVENICSCVEKNLQRGCLKSLVLKTWDTEEASYVDLTDDDMARLLGSLEHQPDNSTSTAPRSTLENLSIRKMTPESTRLFGIIANTAVLQSPSTYSLKSLDIEVRDTFFEDEVNYGSPGAIEGSDDLLNALVKSTIERVTISTDRQLNLRSVLRLVTTPGCSIVHFNIQCSQYEDDNEYEQWHDCFPTIMDEIMDENDVSDALLLPSSNTRSIRIRESRCDTNEWDHWELNADECLKFLNFWLPLISSERLPFLGHLTWATDDDSKWVATIDGEHLFKLLNVWLERNRVGRALLLPSVSSGMNTGFFSVVLEHATSRQPSIPYTSRQPSIPYDGIYFMVQGLVGAGYIGGRGEENNSTGISGPGSAS